MTKNKVKLEYITNDSARKAAFKKRKKGLLKKVRELTTLCEVDACVIIYSPYDSRPEVWPNPGGALRTLARFKSLSKEDQGKKMLDQETYLRQRIAKVNQQLEKARSDNREKEITKLMYDCMNGVRTLEGMSLEDVKDICLMAEKTLGVVSKRIEKFEKNA